MAKKKTSKKESQKKKISRKKVSSNKASKKKASNKKSTQKKFSRPPIVEIEDVYRILNRIQTEYEQAALSVSPDDGDVAENIISDLELSYKKRKLKTRVDFTIFPPEKGKTDDEITEEVFQENLYAIERYIFFRGRQRF